MDVDPHSPPRQQFSTYSALSPGLSPIISRGVARHPSAVEMVKKPPLDSSSVGVGIAEVPEMHEHQLLGVSKMSSESFNTSCTSNYDVQDNSAYIFSSMLQLDDTDDEVIGDIIHSEPQNDSLLYEQSIHSATMLGNSLSFSSSFTDQPDIGNINGKQTVSSSVAGSDPTDVAAEDIPHAQPRTPLRHTYDTTTPIPTPNQPMTDNSLPSRVSTIDQVSDNFNESSFSSSLLHISSTSDTSLPIVPRVLQYQTGDADIPDSADRIHRNNNSEVGHSAENTSSNANPRTPSVHQSGHRYQQQHILRRFPILPSGNMTDTAESYVSNAESDQFTAESSDGENMLKSGKKFTLFDEKYLETQDTDSSQGGGSEEVSYHTRQAYSGKPPPSPVYHDHDRYANANRRDANDNPKNTNDYMYKQPRSTSSARTPGTASTTSTHFGNPAASHASHSSDLHSHDYVDRPTATESTGMGSPRSGLYSPIRPSTHIHTNHHSVQGHKSTPKYTPGSHARTSRPHPPYEQSEYSDDSPFHPANCPRLSIKLQKWIKKHKLRLDKSYGHKANYNLETAHPRVLETPPPGVNKKVLDPYLESSVGYNGMNGRLNRHGVATGSVPSYGQYEYGANGYGGILYGTFGMENDTNLQDGPLPFNRHLNEGRYGQPFNTHAPYSIPRTSVPYSSTSSSSTLGDSSFYRYTTSQGPSYTSLSPYSPVHSSPRLYGSVLGTSTSTGLIVRHSVGKRFLPMESPLCYTDATFWTARLQRRPGYSINIS